MIFVITVVKHFILLSVWGMIANPINVFKLSKLGILNY